MKIIRASVTAMISEQTAMIRQQLAGRIGNGQRTVSSVGGSSNRQCRRQPRVRGWAGGSLLLLIVLICQPLVAEAQWTYNGSNIYNTNGGNVGVGTDTPGDRLTVRGSGYNTSSGAVVQNVDPNYWSTTHLSAANDQGRSVSLNMRSFNNGLWSNGGIVATDGNELGFLTHYSAPINFYVYGASGNGYTVPKMTLTPLGNLGIGTTAPNAPLQFANTVANRKVVLFDGTNNDHQYYGFGVNNYTLRYQVDSTSANHVFYAGNGGGGSNELMRITGTGNVNVVGTLTAGNLTAKYQDVAEWVVSSQKIAAGTVVIVDPSSPNQVRESTGAYDTSVAGVVSAQPGLLLGTGAANKVKVATTGRVKVRVDARNGAIKMGDLLVTSDIPGTAQRSEPVDLGGVQMHRPGTIIGKALEPLAAGKTGEILVLLSLQ